MELSITGKNLPITESVRTHVTRKLGKLDRYLPRVQSAEVELTRQATKSAKERVVVQVTLNANGALIRAQERGADLFAAVDQASDALKKQLERLKARLYKSSRQPSASTEAASLESVEEGRIVRVKRFPMKPMVPEEAIEEMELLGHDFFLFYNSQTNSYNVLYKRSDGNYGIIEPQPL